MKGLHARGMIAQEGLEWLFAPALTAQPDVRAAGCRDQAGRHAQTNRSPAARTCGGAKMGRVAPKPGQALDRALGGEQLVSPLGLCSEKACIKVISFLSHVRLPQVSVGRTSGSSPSLSKWFTSSMASGCVEDEPRDAWRTSGCSSFLTSFVLVVVSAMRLVDL